MQKADFKKMVVAALVAALSCVSAIVLHIHVPIPGINGCMHLGDALAILSGMVLGPMYGGLAAGVGMAMADFLTGHVVYVLPTLVLQFFVAFFAGLLYRVLAKNGKAVWLAVLLAGLVDALLVVGGYFAFECLFYNFAGALAGVPANLVRGVAGIVLSLLFYPALSAIPEVRRLLQQNKKGK